MEVSTAKEPGPEGISPDVVIIEKQAGRHSLHGVFSKTAHGQPGNPVGLAGTPPSPPPDGGYGWVCCVAVALVNAHSWGLNSSYSVFLAYYLANDVFPGGTPLRYAFIGSLSIACALAVSPLATICVRDLGTKPTMSFGLILEAGSFICASFTTQIWHLFLTQGIMFGVGMGFLFVASVGIVPQWFTTKRSLANGISTGGSGLGGLVYSLAAGAMIRNLGLDWAFRVLGIIAFVVNGLCIVVIKDRNKIIGSSQLAFDMTIFRRPEYILVLAWGWFSMLAYVVLVFSLANYANEIGLNDSQASLISAFFNLGQALGRPCIGYFSDRTGRLNMATAMTYLAAIFCLVIWINAKSYGVLIFFSIVGGAVGGTLWAVVAPVTVEVLGLKDVPSGLNLMWLVLVLPATFSTPIGLQIVEGTGSYLGTQLWTGFMYIAAGMCMMVVRGWKIGELRELTNTGNVDDVKVDDEAKARSRSVGRKRMLVDFWKKHKV